MPRFDASHLSPHSPSVHLAETHRVENQSSPLLDYNTYASDRALREAVVAQDAGWGEEELLRFGVLTGSAELIELGFEANASLNKPALRTHSRYGDRVDEIHYHPAYHRFMDISIREGLHSSAWASPQAGAQVVRAAKNYLMGQAEAGHLCPITMTTASIPTLRHQPDLFERWSAKINARVYDPRNIPIAKKAGITIGMAMTEKQGGSDVRSNSTTATPVDAGGTAGEYLLVGHKYFVSAPMCDAFLVLAQAPAGLSCFLVPRWRPDGSKNPLQIQQLKHKMGNVSNASCETELRGALGWLVGDEGRGVAVILDMVAMTRFDCMVSSSQLMRQGIVQATHHCARRSAFGALLSHQPLMQNVLADLILEHEGALAMTMRIGRALDNSDDNPTEKLLVRIGTAIGKYWICKRAAGHAAETMECIGGMGLMEDTIMPRLLRETPVNSIWEGSGNVQCLDLLRSLQREPGALATFLAELHGARGASDLLDRESDLLAVEIGRRTADEYGARALAGRMARALQAASLYRFADPQVAEAFCRSRLGGSGWTYGNLSRDIDCEMLIQRATPSL